MSKLEEKILNSLDIIGYDGPIMEKSNFAFAIEGGPKSVEYTQLVNYLTNEIRTLLGIDEEVNVISSPEDSVSFIMEVTSFLKELNCPYMCLMEGHVSNRLQIVSDRMLLLDYLLTELMSARILQEKKPTKKIELKLQETPEGKDMRLILQTLRFPKPPANISISTLFQRIIPTIPLVIKKAGTDIVGKGIFNGFLSNQQWDTIKNVQEDLHKEYKIRREMLLTRLDVTIQSFQWSDRTKGKDDVFDKLYNERRKLLKTEPDVDISDLLAARTDIAIIEKTSNSSVRKFTKSALNKVIIGQVPDRGGRTSEIAPPPPEMPSWQQRSVAPGGGRGGGNNSYNRGGNNNYNRGGNNYNRDSNNYNRGGGSSNYNQDRGRGGSNTGQNYNYDQSRGYGDNRNFDSAGNYGTRSYDNYQGNNTGHNKSNYEHRRDSYSSQDYQQSSKRAKTYDSFQANKTTYADQYVQERQHNQQYQSRGNWRGGSGRGNYRRGGNYQR